MVCAVLLAGCGSGGGGGVCCRTSPVVVRGASYVSSIAADDGGVPTQVKITVGTTGATRITFERDGVQVVESFSAR